MTHRTPEGEGPPAVVTHVTGEGTQRPDESQRLLWIKTHFDVSPHVEGWASVAGSFRDKLGHV